MLLHISELDNIIMAGNSTAIWGQKNVIIFHLSFLFGTHRCMTTLVSHDAQLVHKANYTLELGQ